MPVYHLRGLPYTGRIVLGYLIQALFRRERVFVYHYVVSGLQLMVFGGPIRAVHVPRKYSRRGGVRVQRSSFRFILRVVNHVLMGVRGGRLF